MNFQLSDEQKMLRNTIRQLVAEEIAPNAFYYDQNWEFPKKNIEKLLEFGVYGMNIPKDIGGSGMDTLSFAIAIEEIAKGCASTATIMNTTGGFKVLAEYGKPALIEKYIKPVLQNKVVISGISMTEPSGGSDIGSMKTTADKTDNGWVINGSKVFTTNGGVADFYIVLARTDRNLPGTKGIGAIVVEKDTQGLTFGPNEKSMGLHGAPHQSLHFENCIVPLENTLTLPPNGFKQIIQVFNTERIGNASICLGLSQRALEIALEYSKERVAFGEPLSKKQGIQWILADMAIKVEIMRNMIYRAAFELDHGNEFIKLSSMAKIYANEQSLDVINSAMQILGGYGYMQEYELERMWRDARVYSYGAGTTQIHRNSIASQVLK